MLLAERSGPNTNAKTSVLIVVYRMKMSFKLITSEVKKLKSVVSIFFGHTTGELNRKEKKCTKSVCLDVVSVISKKRKNCGPFNVINHEAKNPYAN